MSTDTPDRRGIVRPLSVAPMMQRTDRHFRVLMRHLTRNTSYRNGDHRSDHLR